MNPTGWRRGAGPYRFALIGLALIALVTYAAFEHRLPLIGGGGYEIDAVVENASQLDVGSPVRIAGITVGSVTGISRAHGTDAQIRMSIGAEGLPIHRDATLEIRPRLFLEGNFYVDLHPGSPGSPLLRAGGTIPAGQTSIAVQIDQFLSTFDTPIRSSLKGVLAQVSAALSGGGAQGLHATTEQIAPVLDQTALLTRALRGTAVHDLSSLVDSASQVTGTLAIHDAQLASLVTNAAAVAQTVAAHDAQLAASVSGLDALDKATPAPLRALDGSLPPLREFSAALTPSLRDAAPVLNDASALLDQLEALSRPAQLPRLLALLAPSLAQLPTLERRVDQLFPLVTPVAQCISRHVLPVLNATVPDGSLSSGRPVWQELGYVAVALASYAQDFDGSGNYPRALGGDGDQTVSTGAIPGEGQLFADVSQPLVGERPVWLGPDVPPPYRPDVPCSADPPVSLAATTGAPDVHTVSGGGQ
jgi:phospholipid/cholesterol/gamma-HCH transport system substrate-binding protein